jgi:hypothetical protein
MLTYQSGMLTTGIFSLTILCQHGDIVDGELSGDKMPDAGRNMIHIGEKGAQKTHAPYLQGNTQTIVIASAFSDKFLVCLIKMKISGQLKLIRFTGEPAIAFSLFSGQKIDGHIGLSA